MSDIPTVTLELLRAGPAHNQLVSPLTPYVALCGSEGPVTVHLPFEQHQLLHRLQRLRYVSDGGAVPAEQREAELLEIGAIIGEVFSNIPTLNAQLALVRRSENTVINLRIVVAGSELALVPFEFVTAPEGFPGPGLPLLLQADTPIVLTRGVRRGQRLQVEWDRKPRILFVSASPPGLAEVPTQQHLNALRRAIDPWVWWAPTEEELLVEVKKHITVLPDASLEKIQAACESAQYTHIHILAHGIPYKEAGELRYGLALCGDANPASLQTVPGRALAQALRPTDGTTRSRPTMVSLASCDSGNVGSVLTPGASVAHDLHTFGIPWVVASQFPLTMGGSVTVAETLYTRLLRGDDPRWVLYQLRQDLSSRRRSDHDWASLVVYASDPPDFTQQVEKFRDRQMRAALEAKFDKADKLIRCSNPQGEIEAVFKAIDNDLRPWREDPFDPLWLRDDPPDRDALYQRVERFGMVAASKKRVAALRHKQLSASATEEEKKRVEKEIAALLREARDWYRKAMLIDSANHWVVTQYLSLSAVLNPGIGKKEPGERDWWIVARRTVSSLLDRGRDGDRAWAYATLAELELLGTVYGVGDQLEPQHVAEQVSGYCRNIGALMGPDSFQVASTRRQFERYRDWWAEACGAWRDIADAAIKVLASDSRDVD